MAGETIDKTLRHYAIIQWRETWRYVELDKVICKYIEQPDKK